MLSLWLCKLCIIILQAVASPNYFLPPGTTIPASLVPICIPTSILLKERLGRRQGIQSRRIDTESHQGIRYYLYRKDNDDNVIMNTAVP